MARDLILIMSLKEIRSLSEFMVSEQPAIQPGMI